MHQIDLTPLRGARQFMPALAEKESIMKKVFISYSSQDSWVARQVADELKTHEIETFIAEKDIEAGESIDEPVKNALNDADAVIFLVTPASVKSSWLFIELGGATALRKRIIPVVYGVSFNELPDLFARYQSIELNDLDRLIQNLKVQGEEKKLVPKSRTPIPEKKQPRIFMSYAHEDREWLNKIRIHLKVLQHEGLRFEIWDDTRIRPGSSWKKEIEEALAASSIGILIVSTDFLASDFVVSNELPELLIKARDDGLVILPLIVRPCRYTKHKSLSSLQSVNDPEKSLVSLENYKQEEILVKLADAVEERITHIS